MFHVSFISRPWEAKSKDPKSAEPSKECFEFWETFRDFQFDKLPVQVKILGIWTALCERYGDQICVIGHRSGFIEAAGRIGIPILYLNDERQSMGADPKQQSRLLFYASAVPCLEGDRLRELADVMNTLIPVEALKTRDHPESIEILRVPNGLKQELKAAIFMYMCCRLPSELPAWTARVEMMHEKVGARVAVSKIQLCEG